MTPFPALGRRALLTGFSALALAAALPGLALAQDADARVIDEITMGDPDAPITMIEYASFTCPHCKNFHEGVLPQIRENYIDTGKVRLIYRPVYFDGPGLWADLLARCAGPDRYLGITSLLYERQRDWAGAGNPADIAKGLIEVGRMAGLEEDQVDACLQDQEHARDLVAAFQQNAVRDSVTATPSFIVNGTPYSNRSYEAFAAIFDALLD